MSHSHPEALFCCPTMPKHPSALARDRAAKPLQPISTVRHFTLHPDCSQSLTSYMYLESSLSKASFRQSSHGTVSYRITTGLVPLIQGRYQDGGWVTAMLLGNLSCFTRFTRSCQSLAEVRMPAGAFFAGATCSAVLTKVIVFFEGHNCFAHASPVLMA